MYRHNIDYIMKHIDYIMTNIDYILKIDCMQKEYRVPTWF